MKGARVGGERTAELPELLAVVGTTSDDLRMLITFELEGGAEARAVTGDRCAGLYPQD